MKPSLSPKEGRGISALHASQCTADVLHNLLFMGEINLEDLIRKIEELRRELNKLSLCKCLTDPEIVKASQRLDLALNEYNNMLKNL